MEPLDPRLSETLARSHFGALGPDEIARLTAGSRRVRSAAGTVTHREGDREAHLELIIAGLVRAFVTAPDGRTMTIRYGRAGAILGAVSLYARPFTMPATTICLLDTDVLALDPPHVRRLADDDPRIARALLGELSERVASFVAEIPASAFATVRQRVARHVLDLAAEGGDAGLVARVTQQELADGVGTAREVVVRVLRELRSEGLVLTSRAGITVVDPVRLLGETFAAAAAPNLADDWNPGS